MNNKSFYVCPALCALGILAYGQTLNYPFVHDEVVFIQNNPLITHFNWNEIIHGTGTAVSKWSSTILNAYYRPFLELFYRIEFALFGLDPAGYHGVNILFHIVNSMLVYALVNLLSGKKEGFSFVLALLFLLHPVQTESVACISGISNLLFTFFSLVSLYFYFWGRQRPDTKMYLVSLTAFFLALLTKEQAVMLPVLFLWLEVFFGKNNPPSRRYIWIGAYFVLLAGYFILRKFLMAGGAVPSILFNQELMLRVLSIPRTLLMYLGVIFTFDDLHYYRSVDILQPPGSGIVGLLGVILGVILIIRRTPGPYKRLLLAGAGWFVISLLPVLNVVPIINEYSLILTAEHFLYLPLVGVIMFIAGLGAFGLSLMKEQWQRIGGPVAVGVLALVFLVVTMRQNSVWAGEIPLLEQTVRHEPRFGRAHMLLAHAYLRNREPAKAIMEFQRALSILEGYIPKTGGLQVKTIYAGFIKEIYIGLANAFEALGDFQQGIEAYGEALKFDPNDADVHNNLGTGHMRQGNWEQAKGHFKKAIALDPNHLTAMNNLAVCYLSTGQREQGEAILREILRLNPQFGLAQKNLEKLLRSPETEGQ